MCCSKKVTYFLASVRTITWNILFLYFCILFPPVTCIVWFTVINIELLTYIKTALHITVCPSQTVRHFSNSGGLISLTYVACHSSWVEVDSSVWQNPSWAECKHSSSEEVSHSCFKGISGFITIDYRSLPSLLSLTKWIQSTSSHLVSHIINLNITLLHVAGSPKWHPSFGFSKTYCLHLSSLSCVLI